MHVIYDGPDKKLKVFDQNGAEIFQCEASNDAINSPAFTFEGSCPPGDYLLGAPEANNPNQPSTTDNDWIAEGLWFVPLKDVNQLWNAYGRSDIGIHGGGSCIYAAGGNPLAPQQGWCVTEGCIRLQNADLATFVTMLGNAKTTSISVVQTTVQTILEAVESLRKALHPNPKSLKLFLP